MNVAVVRRQYFLIASLLYFYALSAVDNIVERFNKSIVKCRDTQHNALAVWIVVLIIIIVGGLTLAGLMWACNKFGGGKSFAGKFKILGQQVSILCK